MHQWKSLHEYCSFETQKVDFFSKMFEIDEIEFCPYPEKRNRPCFVNISFTLVMIHQWKGVHAYCSIELQKVYFFLKKLDEIELCPYPEKRNCPGFVDISPILVIDTSMVRCSRVLQH